MKSHHVEKLIDFQYSEGNPAVELINLPGGNKMQILSELNQIVFISNGVLTVSYSAISDKKVKDGESILMPMHSPYIFTALTDATVLVMKLNNNVNFHDYFPSDLLSKEDKIDEKNIGFLKPCQRMIEFSNTVKNHLDDGINNVRFFDLKIEEFLFLIRLYCDKKQISNFFAAIYNSDFIFSNAILRNFDKAKTVKDLAILFDYSLSGFEKKFKRVFNQSPYQWMQMQRAKRILHEINYSPKTFTKIAAEYGFSSPAHFNDFCRLFFASTPGKLRKKIRLGLA